MTKFLLVIPPCYIVAHDSRSGPTYSAHDSDSARFSTSSLRALTTHAPPTSIDMEATHLTRKGENAYEEDKYREDCQFEWPHSFKDTNLLERIAMIEWNLHYEKYCTLS